MAEEAWSSISCGRRLGGLNWQVMSDDSHLCVITDNLLKCALFVLSYEKKCCESKREKGTELTEVTYTRTHVYLHVPECELCWWTWARRNTRNTGKVFYFVFFCWSDESVLKSASWRNQINFGWSKGLIKLLKIWFVSSFMMKLRIGISVSNLYYLQY